MGRCIFDARKGGKGLVLLMEYCIAWAVALFATIGALFAKERSKLPIAGRRLTIVSMQTVECGCLVGHFYFWPEYVILCAGFGGLQKKKRPKSSLSAFIFSM